MNQLIIANWKSNKTFSEVEMWLQDFSPALQVEQEVVIVPPYPFLNLVASKTQQQENLSLAVQDLSPFSAGSYTGAVGVRNLEGLGVKYAILGHSERRRYFKETHQDVAQKVELALQAKIKPVVCLDVAYLAEQASVLSQKQLEKCIVAYEPLSAIGSGDNMDPEKVASAVKRIKEVFGEIPVLYGGSVNPSNVADYREVVGGVLVGGASLGVEVFQELVERS